MVDSQLAEALDAARNALDRDTDAELVRAVNGLAEAAGQLAQALGGMGSR